jgi:hypothetical protein
MITNNIGIESAMKHSAVLFLVVSSTCSTVSILCRASSQGVLQYCTRGFCYTKKESFNPSLKLKGLNFCTDAGGHVRDCELFEILGTGQAETFQAVECKTASCKRMQEEMFQKEASTSQVYSTMDGETMELMDLDKGEHVSWKEQPQRGRCYDQSLAYEFDCNLVEILDEGLVLIEDLRAGGIFAVQPKSGFSTREGKNQQAPRTPSVVTGSGITDPTQDFRTNVSLNLEGL